MSKLPAKIKLDFASEEFPAKTGYKNGAAFNRSFSTYEVTPEEFLAMCKKGRAHTQELSKFPPSHYGRTDAGTFKIIENVQSMSVIVIDDDSGADDVVDWWLNDNFFKAHGYAIIESSSSTPEAQKVHVVFILDIPITERDLMKLALKAMCAKYPRVDFLHNVERTIYNGIDCNQYVIGKVLPFQHLWKYIVSPYQKLIEKEREAQIKLRERQLIDWESRPKVEYSQSSVRRWLEKAYNGILDKLAGSTRERNTALLNASMRIGAFTRSRWVQPHLDIFSMAEEGVVNACYANGYIDEYCRGESWDVQRIYRIGIDANDWTIDEPLWYGTPLNPDTTDRKHVQVTTPSSTSKVDNETLVRMLEDRYWAGYREGFLDGFIAGMSAGGTQYWEIMGVPASYHSLYKLGYDSENERLVIPSYDHDHRLINVQYWTNKDGVIQVENEHDSPVGHLYQPYPVTDHSHTTLLVTDPLQAVLATSAMLEFADRNNCEPLAVYCLQHGSMSKESEALVRQIDTEKVILVHPHGDSSFTRDEKEAVSGFMTIIEPMVTLSHMLQHNDDLGWLSRMESRSLYKV